MPANASSPRSADDITFVQLRTFACAAQVGSFARTAEELDITQPAVSERIKALEALLGRHLFLRRKGTTPVLTEEGQEVFETVQTILSSLEKLFSREGRTAEKTILRLSVGPNLRDTYLKPLIPRICQDHPEVEIEFHPMISPVVVTRQIKRGELDLAVYAISDSTTPSPYMVSDMTELSSFNHSVCELPMALIAPPGTGARLSSGECLIEDMQFIFPLRRDLGVRWARVRLRLMGLAPRIPPLFVEFPDVVSRMVEDGQGVACMMTRSVADKIAAGRVEVLDIPVVPMRRLLVRSPHAPPVARHVERMLCEAFSA